MVGRFNDKVAAAGGGKLDADQYDVLREYMGYGSGQINGPLLGTRMNSPDHKAVVQVMDAALKKLPSYKGSATRVMQLSEREMAAFVAQMKPGATVASPAFVSAAAGDKPAKGFKGNVTMTMQSNGAARNFSMMSAFGGAEREVIFPRDTKFKVQSVNKTKSGVHLVVVEQAAARPANDELRIIEIAPDVFMLANDEAQFEESKHPRDNGGKFASTAGGGGSSGKSSKGGGAPKHNPVATSSIPSTANYNLKKIGAQMGSNPGGVYSYGAKKYYIKAAKTSAHVTNELRAAKLFALTGSPTLKYQPIEGGKEIATELQHLDKKNAGELSPAEKKEAQADFITHAWLANHDAAGTGGDNIGVIGGKVTPLDFGGALEYRAQGEAKANFGDKVTETKTMIDPAISPDAAKLYGDMTPEQLKDSAQRVVNISDEDIRNAVGIGPGAGPLADKLIARKNDIAKQFNLEFEAKHDRDEKGHFKKMAEEAFAEVADGPMNMVEQNESLFWDGGTEIYKTKEGYVSALLIDGGVDDMDFFKTLPEAQASAAKMMAAQGAKSNSEPATAAPAEPEPTSFKSKKDHVAHLLSKGTTAAEILAATGWPSVSVPAQAKAAGMKLEKTTVNGKTVYKGIPMTDAEKAEAKAAPKPAKTEAPKPAPAPAAAAPAPAVKATPAEIQKAKSANPVPQSMLPHLNPGALQEFNKNYAGENAPKTDAEAQKKIEVFKALQNMNKTMEASQKAEQQAKQAAANKAAAAKLKEAQEAAHAQNKKYMDALGISEVEATGFHALVSMLGGGAGDVIEKFKSYEKDAEKLGYPISGFQYALIRNYINGGYSGINKALRKGSTSTAQHVYTKLVNDALGKLPKFNGTVTRGTDLNAEDLARYQPGQVVEERAFTSTGIGYKFGGNVHYTIKSNGMRAADFSQGANKSEKEVLFKAHTFFLVHKVEKKGSTTYIEMEEVEGHG